MHLTHLRIHLAGLLLASSAFGAQPAHSAAHGDPACEKRLADTGMYVLKSDPKTICDQKPSLATQSCMVELLTDGKGKLKNQDYVQVYALCKVDPSKEMKDCYRAGLAPSATDPKYVPVQKILDRCLAARKKITSKQHPKSKK